MLVGDNIFLREMEKGDEIPIYKWENDTSNWEFGDTQEEFTKEQIIDFVNENQNLEEQQQLRFMICLNTSELAIGCIDLFEYDKLINVAGVGILIGEQQFRKKGFANEALILLISHCKSIWKLKKIFCNISPSNSTSIRLFEKNNFKFVDKRELFNQEVNYYELDL